MDNSIYITLSGQMNKFQDMAITANNIANVNTTGYNAQKLSFSSHLVKQGKTGEQDAYSDLPSSYRDTSNGPLEVTNNPLDVAITGHGYFQVQTPLGTRYTKAGSFQLSAEGLLVNDNGYPVLSQDNSTIAIPTDAKKIEINGIGQISADGQATGQLGVVEFANEQAMTRLGNSLYDSKTPPTPAITSRVAQGALEGSNVSSVTELVKVMDISRSVGDTAKFIEAMYDLEQKGATSLSRPKSS